MLLAEDSLLPKVIVFKSCDELFLLVQYTIFIFGQLDDYNFKTKSLFYQSKEVDATQKKFKKGQETHESNCPTGAKSAQISY